MSLTLPLGWVGVLQCPSIPSTLRLNRSVGRSQRAKPSTPLASNTRFLKVEWSLVSSQPDPDGGLSLEAINVEESNIRPRVSNRAGNAYFYQNRQEPHVRQGRNRATTAASWTWKART